MATVAVRLNAITGDFERAFSNATKTMSGFDRAFANAAVSIQGHQARINKAFSDFSGANITREAGALAAAITQIGGASKLTAAEQQRVNATVTEAIEKYRVLGQTAPKSLVDLEQATRRVVVETKTLEQPVSRVSGFFNDLGTQVKATALGFIGAQAVIGGVQASFRALTTFVSDSVKAFADAEAAQKKLTTAIAASSSGDVARLTEQYNRLSAQFQQTTVYSDDLITEMQALLVQVGNVMPAEMESALKAATNLASGLGVDLRTATLLVGKAFEGETGTLKRYGIVIDEAKLKAEGMPAVLDAIQQRFGGQAAAEIETFSGRIQQLANDFDNFQEAVGKAIANDAFIRQALDGIKNSVKGVSAEAEAGEASLTEWWVAVFGGFKAGPLPNAALLGFEQILRAMQDIESEARKLKGLTPGTPDLFRANTGAPTTGLGFDVSAYLEKSRREMDAAKRSAEAFAASVRTLTQRLSGAALQGEVTKLGAALVSLKRAGDDTPEALKRTADAALELYREGARLTPELFQLVAASGRLSDLMPPVRSGMQGIEKEFRDVTPAIKQSAEELIEFNAALNDPKLRGVLGVSGLQLPGEKIGKIDIPEPDEDLREWSQRVQRNIEAAFDPLDAIAGQLDGIGGDFARFGVQAATAFAKVAAGAITSAQAIQSLQAGAYGLLVNLLAFGLTETFREQAPVTRQMREDFERQFGGRQGLEQQARMANVNLSSLDSQDSAAVFQQLTAPRIQRAIEEQQAAMERYNLTWRDFGIEVRQAQITLHSSTLFRDFQRLTKAGADASKVLTGMSGDLNQLIIDAVKTGTRIPGALRPMLETLIRSGQISEDAARALLGIADDGMPALADITAAAERYGLTLDQLGPKVQQLRINEAAKQIAADFKLLTDAGADATVVAQGMKEKIQDILDQSWKTGSEVPIALKPIIEILIRMGLLVDDNGVKLENIDSINFGKDLVGAIDDLILKLDELISKLIDVRDVQDEINGWRPRDPDNPPIGNAIPRPQPPTSPAPGPALPDDTGVPLPGARPGPTSFTGSTADQSATAFTGTDVVPSGSGGLTATFVMNVDGRTLAEATVPYIPGEVQRFGLA